MAKVGQKAWLMCQIVVTLGTITNPTGELRSGMWHQIHDWHMWCCVNKNQHQHDVMWICGWLVKSKLFRTVAGLQCSVSSLPFSQKYQFLRFPFCLFQGHDRKDAWITIRILSSIWVGKYCGTADKTAAGIPSSQMGTSTCPSSREWHKSLGSCTQKRDPKDLLTSYFRSAPFQLQWPFQEWNNGHKIYFNKNKCKYKKKQ